MFLNVYLDDKLIEEEHTSFKQNTLQDLRKELGFEDLKKFGIICNQNFSETQNDVENRTLIELLGDEEDIKFFTLKQKESTLNNVHSQIKVEYYDFDPLAEPLPNVPVVINIPPTTQVQNNNIDQDQTSQEEEKKIQPKQSQNDDSCKKNKNKNEIEIEENKSDSEREKNQKLLDQQINILNEQQNGDQFEEQIQLQHDSYNDIFKMPQCVEKSLKLLLVFLWSKIMPNSFDIETENLNEQIQKAMSSLKTSLDDEEIFSSKIENYLESLKYDIQKNNKDNLLDGIKKLQKCMELTRSLDFQEFFRLNSMTEEASEKVKDQDIILFLGGTGAGKSTTMHFLLGETMQWTKKYNLEHLEPVDPVHKDITLSPQAKSITRYINPKTLHLKTINKYAKEGEVVILCDSPGFGDLSGPEVDIANSIGIIKALHQARSVRPVAVFSSDSQGDRFEGVQKICNILVGMIKNCGDHIESMSYLFTKYFKRNTFDLNCLEDKSKYNKIYNELSQEIWAKIDNFIIENNDQLDLNENFRKFMIHMAENTQDGAKIIEPFNQKPFDIIKYIKRSSAITNPSEVFQCAISKESLYKMEDQLGKHQQAIMNACNKNNYPFVEYRLQELITFSKIIDKEQVKKAINKILSQISQFLKDSYIEATKLINIYLQIENQFTKEQLEEYLEKVQKVQNFDKIIQDYHLKSTPSSKDYYQHLLCESQAILDELNKISEITNLGIKVLLEKLRVLSKVNQQQNELYIQAKQNIIRRIDEIKRSAQNNIHEEDFEQFLSNLNTLGIASSFLQSYIQEEFNIESSIQQLVHKYQQNIEMKQNIAKEILSKNTIQLQDSILINETILQLKLIQNQIRQYKSLEFLQPQNINQSIELIYLDIINRIKLYTEEIQIKLKEDPAQYIRELEQQFSQIIIMRKVVSIDLKTSNEYHLSIKNVEDFIQSQKKDIESFLNSSLSDSNMDLSQLRQSIIILENAKWIQEYKSDIYSNTKQLINEKILNFTKGLQKQLLKLTINFQNTSQLKEAEKIFEKFASLKELISVVEGLEDFIQSSEQNFYEHIQQYLNIAQDVAQDDNRQAFKDLYKLNQCFNFLYDCKSTTFLQNLNILQSYEKFQTSIQLYGKHIEKDIYENLIIINNSKYQNNEELQKIVNQVVQRLKELKEVKDKNYFYNIFNIRDFYNYDNLQQKIKILYDCCHNDLLQYNQTKQNSQMVQKLSEVKTLSELDIFLDGNQPFMHLYRDQFSSFYSEAPRSFIEIQQDIINHNFKFVALKISTFQIEDPQFQRQYNVVVNSLKQTCEDIITETKNKTSFLIYEALNIEIVKDINKNIEKLNQIIEIGNEIIGEDLIKKIRYNINNVYQDILEFITKEIENIQGFISNHNFPDASKSLNNIEFICKVSDQNPHSLEIIKEVRQLEEKLNKELKQIIQNYVDQPLSYLSKVSPIIIFQKLERDIRNQVYEKVKSEIAETILQKFQEQLSILTTDESLTQNSRERKLKELEKLLKFLPEQIRLQIQNDIESEKEDILNKAKNLDEEIQADIKSNDVENLIHIYQAEINGSRSVNSNKMIKDYILEQLLRQKDDIYSYIKIENLNSALEYLVKFNMFTSQIKHNFPNEVIKTSKEIKEGMEKLIKSNIKRIQKFIEQLKNTSVIESEIIVESNLYTPRKYNLADLDNFSNLEQERDNSQFYDQALQDLNQCIFNIDQVKVVIPKIKEDLQKIIEFLYNFFQENNSSFQAQIQKQEYKKIKIQIIVFKKSNDLFKEFRSNIQNYINENILEEKVKADVIKMKIYEDVIKEVQNQIEYICKDLQSQDIINQEIVSNQNNRSKVYNKINGEINALNHAPNLKGYIRDEIIQLSTQSIETVELKVQNIIQNIEQLIIKDNLNEDQLKEFAQSFASLMAFQTQVAHKQNEFKEKMNNIKNKLNSKCYYLIDTVEKSTDRHVVIQSIIDLKIMSQNIQSLTSELDHKIDRSLLKIRQRENGVQFIKKVGQQLNNSNIGKIIMKEHAAFDGISICLLNQKYQTHGIEHFLTELEGDQYKQQMLNTRYEEYNSLYEERVNSILAKSTKEVEKFHIDELIAEIKQLSSIKHKGEWTQQMSKNVPELLALMCSLWTLMNTHYYFEALEQDDQDFYLFKPHIGQVLSILRILCVADKDNQKLKNNLVQIGTGEGKSVTLALTSSILALYGFNAYCVCYSSYLSQRDYEAFQSLFNILNLSEYIRYDTFNSLSEHIINQKGDIREIVLKRIVNNENFQFMGNEKNLQRPKVLLIDEVDVFFSKDFYGQIYIPSATLRDETVSQLLDYIWENRLTLNYTLLKQSQLYIQTVQKFKNWEKLIDELIKDVLFDSKNFESHDYIVKDNQIGYKEQDRIEYNISFGYKTLFAYYLEKSKNNISQDKLNSMKGLKINCGGFSYAEIPFQFKYILGVTGTLKTLTEPELNIVKNQYNIKHFTYMPSAFGKNNRRFNQQQDVLIENSADFYNSITRQIDNKLKPYQNISLAVLVFFETKEKLQLFRESKAFEQMKPLAYALTEEDTDHDKNYRIKFATASGTITLLTRAFGRGTDFICGDEEVLKNGGVQVILTFLPEEYSEEIQIMGRTARQGAFGAFSMVLEDKDLEKYVGPQYKKELDLNNGNSYAFINKARNAFFNDQYENNKKYINKTKELDKLSNKFVISLTSNTINDIRDFLISQNLGPAMPKSKPSKTIVLMDATGSMSGLLSKAKTTVSDMFERAYVVLKQNNILDDCIMLQFTVYRNYSSLINQIIQSSPWETKPQNLVQFMTQISASGGMGKEAVEIGLQYAAMEATKEKISQVILIGDAPSHEEQETISRRQQCSGENYWANTKFSTPTTYVKEINKLNQLGVPIHTFYVNNYAQENFIKMAKLSKGGTHQYLDINSADGAKQLTDLVTIQILQDIGQQNGQGMDFVESYKKLYQKSFS